MALPGEKHRKGEKCGCISRGCHLFLGGLGRTRPALRELSQLEMSASPATVPYTKSLSLGLYLCGGQNISSNYSSFLSSSWVATQGHAALATCSSELHECTCVASLPVLSASSERLFWASLMCYYGLHVCVPSKFTCRNPNPQWDGNRRYYLPVGGNWATH